MNHLWRALSCALLAFGLQSCAAPLMVSGAAVSGAVIYDQRSFDTITEDHTIAHQINRRLHDVPELRDAANINATSYNHVVLLIGQAPTKAMKQKALTIAKSVPLVRQVYNEITLSSPIPRLTRTSDTWITTKVKSQMLTAKGLHSGNIKVITENGVVYLLGTTVNPEQADIAANVARHVHGVQKVVKAFEYNVTH